MNLYFLLFLLVAGDSWAKPENGRDLNLESVFRTPKDFSNVNFDHFEILERNNFENQDASSPIATNDVTPAEANPLRSVANAQVSLRFGGDNIHDCNRVALPSCRYPKLNRGCDLGFVRPLPCERPAPLPLPLLTPFSEPCYSSYPQYLPLPTFSSTSLYPYVPPPPFAFPGYYYSPRSFPAYPASPFSLFNGQLVPGERIETVVNTPTETIIEEDFIDDFGDEIDMQWTESLDFPEPLESTEVIEEVLPEGTWISTPSALLEEDTFLVDEPAIIEETLVETSPDAAIVTVSSAPEIITVENVALDNSPCPKEVSYVEVSLADAPKCENADAPPKGIETLLNQALIPFTCQKCNNQCNCLVSYPIINNEVVVLNRPEEVIETSGCSSCQNYETHDCCNRQRNPRIPYGKRFSKDLDSLFEVITPNCPLPFIPPSLYQSKFESMPLKTWSPLSLIAPKYFPRLLATTSAPCSDSCLSTAAPLTPVTTTIVTSPTYTTSPSCATEVVEVKNETPCLETTTINKVVEVDSPCADSVTTFSTPCEWSAAPMYSSSYVSAPETDITYNLATGASYYSEPFQTVVYKQPTFWDVIKTPYPTTPIVERKEYVCDALPKYERISEIDIAPVAEVVPATSYVCNECNKAIPLGYVRQMGLFPSAPLGNDWSYGHDLGCKNTLLYPNYIRCPRCAEYKGEINEIEKEQ